MNSKRLMELREKMNSQNLDAYLINGKANRLYLSGFTGTDGQVLITQDKKYIIVDKKQFEEDWY